jgi:serine/threonine protein kinase
MPSYRIRNRARSARSAIASWPGGRLPLGSDAIRGESEAIRPMPARIGDWRLLDEIGRGAWTRVYLARPADTKRGGSGCYAVKVLDPAWEIDSLAIATLRREAIVGMTVSNQHLVSILAAHVHESPHYVVAPFLPGITLAERLRGGRLAIRTATWIARQIASGLEALHEADWLHRAIKPANIVVSPSGHATLVDLGFCQNRNHAASLATAAAADRSIAGTLDYLSPEAATPGIACTTASDLYSLGVLLFEMLTGHLPFAARTAGELAEKHRRSAPPDVAILRPDTPPALARLINVLLAKQPVRRPASAREVIDQLVRMEIAALLRPA